MNSASIRSEALKLVEQLPDESTWDDLQSIERGLEASAQGRTKTIDEVKRRLGITG